MVQAAYSLYLESLSCSRQLFFAAEPCSADALIDVSTCPYANNGLRLDCLQYGLWFQTPVQCMWWVHSTSSMNYEHITSSHATAHKLGCGVQALSCGTSTSTL